MGVRIRIEGSREEIQAVADCLRKGGWQMDSLGRYSSPEDRRPRLVKPDDPPPSLAASGGGAA